VKREEECGVCFREHPYISNIINSFQLLIRTDSLAEIVNCDDFPKMSDPYSGTKSFYHSSSTHLIYVAYCIMRYHELVHFPTKEIVPLHPRTRWLPRRSRGRFRQRCIAALFQPKSQGPSVCGAPHPKDSTTAVLSRPVSLVWPPPSPSLAAENAP